MAHAQEVISGFCSLCLLYVFFGSSTPLRVTALILAFITGAFGVGLSIHAPILEGWAVAK